MKTIQHGTYKGWNAHIRRHIPMCDDCRQAARQYQKQWRANSPKGTANHRRGIKAERLAKQELARRHADEYRKLFLQFKQQLTGNNADN